MSSTLSQHQAPRKRHNFELEEDDSYVGLCGEIYITKKRYVIFHCGLCKEKYGELKRYLRHISRHYANYSQWIDSTAATASDTEHAVTQNDTGADPLTVDDGTENYEYLIEEDREDENIADALEAEAGSMEDALEEALLTVLEIETAEQAANAIDELNVTEIVDDSVENVTKVDRNEVESHNSVKQNKSTSHSEQKRSLRKRQKHPDTNAYSTKERRCEQLIKLEIRSKSENTVDEAAADKDGKKLPTDAEYERKFKCDICGFAFKELFNLRAHMRRHTDPKHYNCTVCPKQFYTRSELTVHQRRHTGERPFTCEQCGLCFISAGSMHEHQKRHSNRRPHKCPQCDKCFYDSYLLKKHFVTHTGERNFVCKTCNARFNLQRSLHTHMKVHANLKEYVCSICQQGFNQLPGLHSHVRNKHRVKT